MDRKRKTFFGFSGLLLLLLCGSGAQAQAPTISSISPTSGPVGSVVILSGTNFGTTQGSNTVSLNGGPNAVVTSWNATSIAVIIPTGASSGTFAVSVGGQNATSATFTVTPLPSGWSDSDIGTVGLSGSSSYANGVFTVEGAGGGMGSRADALHFVYEPLTGNGSIVARIVSLSGGASYEQAGVIVRQALTSGSISASTLFSSNDVLPPISVDDRKPHFKLRPIFDASPVLGGGCLERKFLQRLHVAGRSELVAGWLDSDDIDGIERICRTRSEQRQHYRIGNGHVR